MTLNGEDSYDPSGESLDYSWTQTSGQGVDLQDYDEEQAHFRAPQVNDDDSLILFTPAIAGRLDQLQGAPSQHGRM